MNKKNIILFSIIAGVAIIIAISLFFVFKNGTSVEKTVTSIGQYLPFGTSGENDNDFSQNTTNTEDADAESFTVSGFSNKPLTKIYDKPSAGAVVTDSFARIVDKGTGNIFEYLIAKNTLTRITNITIPEIQEAVWTKSGQVVFLRYLAGDAKTIKTRRLSLSADVCPVFPRILRTGDTGNDVLSLQKLLNTVGNSVIAETGAGSIGNETSSFGQATKKALEIFQQTQELQKTGIFDEKTEERLLNLCEKGNGSKNAVVNDRFFPDGIIELSVSPSGNRVLYLQSEQNGVVGTLTDANNTNPKIVFRHPISEWQTEWLDDSNVLLTTKTSDESLGYAYASNVNNITLNDRVVGGIRGLNTRAQNNLVLFGSSKNGGSVIDKTSGAETSFVENVRIVPEKCTFVSKEKVYCGISLTMGNIDNWYMGIDSSTDRLALLTKGANGWFTANTFSSQEIFNENVDVIHPSSSPSGDFVLFVNKTNGHVWLNKLPN